VPHSLRSLQRVGGLTLNRTNDQRLTTNDRPSQLPKQKRINIRQLFNLRGGVVFEPSPVKGKTP
jgi:hypothetical protein